MVNGHTPRSSLRLLTNAEPFGFGPSAAIADFFPHLRRLFSTMGYVGKGHTLDLQRRLGYEAIHDISGAEPLEQELLRDIFGRYDLFLTALDFGMAEAALAAGLTVIIYDPLAWYMKEIHPVVAKSDLYIAQNFFGVEERIAGAPHLFPNNSVIVPPIIPAERPGSEKRDCLINLGGLNNPFWSSEDTLAYARLIVDGFFKRGEEKKGWFRIVGNAEIAKRLAHDFVDNLTRTQMQGVLARAPYAVMTPGLGNIYDAAHYGIPTIWLPPANDSQGQQLNLLMANGMVDAYIDWKDIIPGVTIDYRGEQATVLRQIAEAVRETSGNADHFQRLACAFDRRVAALNLEQDGACSRLIARFGRGGAEKVADLVFQLSVEKQASVG